MAILAGKDDRQYFGNSLFHPKSKHQMKVFNIALCSPFHAENFSRKFSSYLGSRLSPKILIRNKNSEAPSTGLFFGHFLKLQVKKTKTQEQNKQNSRILPQILEISAIFVHIYKFLDQNQTYFLKKCPITQELSQKIYPIIFLWQFLRNWAFFKEICLILIKKFINVNKNCWYF